MSSSVLTNTSKGPASSTEPGQITTTAQTIAGNKVFINNIKTTEIQANIAASITIKNSSGTTTASVSETGNLSVLNNIQQNSLNVISWVEVTPAFTEWSFAGNSASSINFNPATIPANARYILADVFVTASLADHFNIAFGRASIASLTSWVNTRGTQPSSQFSAGVGSRNVVVMTYPGDADNFSPVAGQWWSSVIIPSNGRQVFYDFTGINSASTTGWVYVIVKAYSL